MTRYRSSMPLLTYYDGTRWPKKSADASFLSSLNTYWPIFETRSFTRKVAYHKSLTTPEVFYYAAVLQAALRALLVLPSACLSRTGFQLKK